MEIASPNWLTIFTEKALPVSVAFGLISLRTDESSVFVIVRFSFGISSSLSFLNQVIFSAVGLEMNLQENSASWPSLTFTFSILAEILGESF